MSLSVLRKFKDQFSDFSPFFESFFLSFLGFNDSLENSKSSKAVICQIKSDNNIFVIKVKYFSHNCKNKVKAHQNNQNNNHQNKY
jgi:hypothetical protein